MFWLAFAAAFVAGCWIGYRLGRGARAVANAPRPTPRMDFYVRPQ